MPHGHTKFPSIGNCIYCNSSDNVLTDEHIVPYFLGGKHVLVKASCENCANITKKFEQDVARELWGDARNSYNAPSRRKKEKPTHISLSDPAGEGQIITVPYKEYPGGFVFYYMPQAGSLYDFPADVDLSHMWQLKVIADDERLKNFEQKHPKRTTIKFRHVPESFGRFIAKIGYCQALTLLSPEDFEPVCLPYIMGEEKNVSYIVGQNPDEDTPISDLGYKLSSLYHGTKFKGKIISEVRLLANNQTPTYHVVVGSVETEERVSNVLKKMGFFDQKP